MKAFKISLANIFIVVFLLFINYSCQNKQDLEEYTTIKNSDPPPPPEKVDKNNLIGFGCYESGEMSTPIKNFTKLIQNKNYQSIRSKLSSKYASERYLSTVSMDFFAKSGLLTITNEEYMQIAKNKNSNSFVFLCSGCTYNNKVQLKDIFVPEKFPLNITYIWLDDLEQQH